MGAVPLMLLLQLLLQPLVLCVSAVAAPAPDPAVRALRPNTPPRPAPQLASLTPLVALPGLRDVNIISISRPNIPNGHTTGRSVARWSTRLNSKGKARLASVFANVTDSAAVDSSGTLERRQSTTPTNVNMTNVRDFMYTAPLSVGSTVFNVNIDSGTADTWVRGTPCTSPDGSCGVAGQTVLGASDSTISRTSLKFSIQYGSGNVSGTIATGPVSIGGLRSVNMSFGVASNMTGFVNQGDGLLGLGFETASLIKSAGATVSSNLLDLLGLATNAYGLYLSLYADTGSNKGELSIGGVDLARFSGPLQYIPLISQYYFQGSLNGATYSMTGGSSAPRGALNSSVSSFIVDSATTLIILDAQTALTMNNYIGATFNNTVSAYTLPCTSTTTRPNVTLTINSLNFTILPAVYVIPYSGSTCLSGFNRGSDAFGAAVLGEVFLRQYYAYFDKTNHRIGFARSLHPAGSAANGGERLPPGTTCAHSICEQGIALSPTCSPCVAAVIAGDSYCGNGWWDSNCIGELTAACVQSSC
ncbi:aspartic peptidase domain-containing protein [Zopfochytrium polystomum]|nr:aspartic peptidase domain-containing protein [Zopfochytrium polystomum]